MTKDKQIVELTRVMCQSNRDGICGYDRKPCHFDCGNYQLATKVYTAGYRKASEVAEDIVRMLRAAGINEWRYPIVAEIKKKYLESEKDDER